MTNRRTSLPTMAGHGLFLGIVLVMLVPRGEAQSLTLIPSGASRAFSFIASIGTRIYLCDDCVSGAIALNGFTFPFGSRGPLSSVAVNSNGNINLIGTDASTGCCTASPISPSSSYSTPRVAVVHADLNPNSAVRVYPLATTAG